MPKEEYRVIKYADGFEIRLLTYYKDYTAYHNILWSETFEGLRSEANKVMEAFGKEIIDNKEIR